MQTRKHERSYRPIQCFRQVVDLYGGTRHSTTTALSEYFTKEQLRESGTMHATNQAFERYMQTQKNDSLKVYQKAQEIKKGKVVKLKKRAG